jgi:hypothetical protein
VNRARPERQPQLLATSNIIPAGADATVAMVLSTPSGEIAQKLPVWRHSPSIGRRATARACNSARDRMPPLLFMLAKVPPVRRCGTDFA